MKSKILHTRNFGDEIAIEIDIEGIIYSGCLTEKKSQRTKHCPSCGSNRTKITYNKDEIIDSVYVQCLRCEFKACIHENYEQEEY